MVLFSLLFCGAVAYGFAGMVSSSKTARLERKLEERGDLDVIRDFDLILEINRVHRTFDGYTDDKIPVLPEMGWNECLDYIREQPLTTGEDEKRFIAHYNKMRQKDLKNRQKIFDEKYERYEKKFYGEDKDKKFSTFTFRKEYWGPGLSDNHQERINKIYNETFFKDIASQPAKLIYNHDKNSYIEIWHVTFWSKVFIDTYYSVCCKKVGFSDYYSL